MLDGHSLCYTSSTKGKQVREACPGQALIKPDPDYKSCVSLSPPLSGGSLRGQPITACFRHASQYYPEKNAIASAKNVEVVATRIWDG